MPPASAADDGASSSPPPFVHAVGGSIGGALATLACYPLEILRVEAQKSRARATRKSEAADDDHDDDDDATDGDGGGARGGGGGKGGDGPRGRGRDDPETTPECFVRLYKERALYRGASAMVTTMIVSSFVTFYELEAIRTSLTRLQAGGGSGGQRRRHLVGKRRRLTNHLRFLAYLLPKSKVGTSLLASSLAGVINVFLTTPLWVGTRHIMESSSSDDELRSEKGSRRQSNLWQVMRRISRDEGVLRLWQGTWSSLLLVSNPAIQYFLYERIRAVVLGRRNRECRRRRLRPAGGGGGDGGAVPSATLTAAEALVFGAAAKTIATVVTYPLQLAQVLIRLRNDEVRRNGCRKRSSLPTAESTTERHDDDDDDDDEDDGTLKEFDGIADCLRHQFQNGGFSSLFHGMNSKLLQTVLQAAFTFATYEETLGVVERAYRRSSSFLAGGR